MTHIVNQNNILYHLPIIVSKKDLEIEQVYSKFYNEDYWKKYKKRKK